VLLSKVTVRVIRVRVIEVLVRVEYGEDGDFGFRGGKCPRGIKIPTFVSSYVSITRESTS